ncbi:MAG: putative metalloprotease CJM1_0395 family protein [bacterium]
MLISIAPSYSSQTYFHFSRGSSNKVEVSPELNAKEQKELQELKKRDAEVRRHEQAHKAAAGQFAKGGPQFQFVTGPDGRRYVVSGEVSIDTSEIPDDPEATIKKARTIKRAALAPANPSSQDRRVAAEASRMETEARRELAQQKTKEAQVYARNGRNVSTPPEPTVLDLHV